MNGMDGILFLVWGIRNRNPNFLSRWERKIILRPATGGTPKGGPKGLRQNRTNGLTTRPG